MPPEVKRLSEKDVTEGFAKIEQLTRMVEAQQKMIATLTQKLTAAPKEEARPDLKTTLSKLHTQHFGPAKDEAARVQDEKLLQFLSDVFTAAAPKGLPEDFDPKKVLDALDNNFDRMEEMSYLLSLKEAERGEVLPLMPDLRDIYRTKALYNRPDDAPKDYNGFGRARAEHLQALERAGLKPAGSKTETSEPRSRIAFTGDGEEERPNLAKIRSQSTEEILKDSPELQDEMGGFNWNKALNIDQEAGVGAEE